MVGLFHPSTLQPGKLRLQTLSMFYFWLNLVFPPVCRRPCPGSRCRGVFCPPLSSGFPLCCEPGKERGFCPWQGLVVINIPYYLFCGGNKCL